MILHAIFGFAVLVTCVSARIDELPTPESRSQGFIIELEPRVQSTGRGKGPAAQLDDLAEGSLDFETKHEFLNTEFFYGLSINAANATVASLIQIQGVQNVWPNWIIERPTTPGFDPPPGPNEMHRQLQSSRKTHQVAHVTGPGKVNAHLQMTGVDRLHALGFRGKGIKVAIIDSGVDYTHPSLGGGYGTGFKVAGGYDLVGDDFNGFNDPQPDEDPGVACMRSSHGTHVAGIVAAYDEQDTGFGLVGIAPEATIYAYRVFSCFGSTTWDIVMEAMERALADEVDIINLSLGGIEFFELARPLLAKIKAKGIAIIASAGNDGDRGPYQTSYPAVDRAAISVGSVNNVVFPTLYNAVDNDNETIEYARVIPIDQGLGQVNVFIADLEDGGWCASELWEKAVNDFPDLEKVVAVASPGSFCADSLIDFGRDHGILHGMEVIENKNDMTIKPQGWYAEFAHMVIPQESFEKIKAGIDKHGTEYVLNVADGSVHDVDQVQGRKMSTFSSYGPSVEMSMRPHLSAPGQNILSTMPTLDGVGYGIDSGTSMAAPHVAGAIALLREAFPNLSVDDMLSLLQSTSVPVQKHGIEGALTTTAQQGAGLINVYNAFKAYSETKFAQTEYNVRDSPSPPKQTLAIRNQSKKKKTYLISHRVALLVKASPRANEDDYVPDLFHWQENNEKAYASVSLSSSTVSVGPGQSAQLTFTLKAPKADPGFLPIYGGFLSVSDGVLNYSIPYLGLPYDRRKASTLDFGRSLDTTASRIEPKARPPVVPQPLIYNYLEEARNVGLQDYTFFSDPAKPEWPALLFTIRQPSSYVRVDLIHPSRTLKADAYGFDRRASEKINAPKQDPIENFLGVPSYGEVMSLVGGMHTPPGSAFQEQIDLRYSPYGTSTVMWYESLASDANGTVFTVPNADYRMLIRALKPGGDWTKKEDYESWIGPILRVANILA